MPPALDLLNISSPASVSPLIEMGAYEALWLEEGASFKTIAQKFLNAPGSIPSDFVPYEICVRTAQRTVDLLDRKRVGQFGIRVHGAGEYPQKLRDASYPVELLYFQGWWNLVEAKSVAVVGTRKPSTQGKLRASRLTKHLVRDGYTIVSGLARGIDTVALTTAIEMKGQVVAVIGTPISDH
jgi:DNA processing protein